MTTNPTGQEALKVAAREVLAEHLERADPDYDWLAMNIRIGSGGEQWAAAIDAMVAFAEALSSTPETPEGYVLVPREPTQEMLIAGCCIPGVSLDAGQRMWSAMLSSSPNKGEG